MRCRYEVDVEKAVEKQIVGAIQSCLRQRMPHLDHQVNVKVIDFVVVLTGVVTTQVERVVCEDLVRSHPLCRAVINYLVIEKDSAMTPAEMSRSIHQAVASHPSMDVRTLTADVVDGTLLLSGAVGSTSQKQMVLQIAQLTPDVRFVRNRMIVDRAVYHLLLEKHERIRRAIAAMHGLQSAHIELSCSNDLTILIGVVRHDWQKRMAEALVTTYSPCLNHLMVLDDATDIDRTADAPSTTDGTNSFVLNRENPPLALQKLPQ